MSSHHHGRQVRIGAHGRNSFSNNGVKRSAENEKSDDKHALPMAYICSKRPEDPKRKRKAMLSHGGNCLTMKESRAINVVGMPPKSNNIGNDEGDVRECFENILVPTSL